MTLPLAKHALMSELGGTPAAVRWAARQLAEGPSGPGLSAPALLKNLRQLGRKARERLVLEESLVELAPPGVALAAPPPVREPPSNRCTRESVRTSPLGTHSPLQLY